MSEKCPNCGFDLTSTFTKTIEDKVRQGYIIKQEEISSKLEETRIQNLDLKNKLNKKEFLLKQELKQELQAEYSTKELILEEKKIDLEGKIKSLEKNKDHEIKLALMRALQKKEEELDATYSLERTEKNEEITRLQNLIQELKSKSIQGSQQAQGEVGELLLEKKLSFEFPLDKTIEVPKGINGADISHYIRDANEKVLGLICIESKNAKKFSNNWISKLKEDMKRNKANYGLLVTLDSPKNYKELESDDLFICGFHNYLIVIKLLRNNILELSKVKSQVSFRNDKKSIIYDYVTGKEFAHWIRSILDYLKDQKSQLETDKRNAQKAFATREKQIEKVIESQQRLIGHFKGLGTGEDFKVLEDTNKEEDLNR